MWKEARKGGDLPSLPFPLSPCSPSHLSHLSHLILRLPPLTSLPQSPLHHISIVSKIGLHNFVRQFCAKGKKIGTLARKYAVQPQYFIIFINEKSIFLDQSANFKIINLPFGIFKIFEFGRCLYQLT